jgi:chromosome segregation ATPase
MKLLRLHLHDYRGIVDREIAFAPTGVTVVEGPNEIGKSCIAEALDLLLDELDSSGKRGVLATQPVDRDVGPEVEAEFETGPYHLRLRKRFVHKALTELTILAPRHENLTGRAGHERVRAILSETLDDGLWRALRIQQGGELSQPDLQGATSLSAALDLAAGAVPAAKEELALYELVREQYQQYWTETGRAKVERSALERTAQEAVNETHEIEEELRSLEHDVERAAALDTDLQSLGPRCVEQEKHVADYVEEVARLDQLALQAQTTKATANVVVATAEKAARAVADREGMVARLQAQAAEKQHIASAVGERAPDLGACREQNQADSEAVAKARADRDARDALARLRRDDASHLRNEQVMADLRGRSDAVRLAHAAMASIQVELDKIQIDDATLSQLRDADIRLKTARASLGSAMPSLRLEGISDTTVDINGETVNLKAGGTIQKAVAAAACVTVPGVLSLTVIPGVSDSALVEEAQASERAFSDLCAATGVADVAQGELAMGTRRRLEGERSEQEQVIQTALGPISLEELEQQLAEVSAGVADYKKSRPKTPPIAADIKSAEAILAEVEAQLRTLTGLVTEAEAREEASRKRRTTLEAEANEQLARLAVVAEALTSLESALAEARKKATDQALAEALQVAREQSEAAVAAAGSAQHELDLANPDETRALLKNAKLVLEGMREGLRQAEDERLAISTRLAEHGEAGLAERRDKAIAAGDVAAEELATYDRRAKARKLLYETFRSARDRVRAAYVGPLQTRVDELGRVVFGPTFRICIDETLSIVSRTMDDKTIPLSSLSAGTREQLAVILRLACATIVASDGGVPVILDDVLGYSDPRRLEAMGAVLSEAGRTSQVIVFTCYPDRYRQVGGAHVVRLD